MKKFYVLFGIILSIAVIFTACGGTSGTSTSTTTSTRSYLATQNPGDVWSWAITTNSGGTGTFTASNDTLGYTYSGDVETLPNNFLKLAVNASSDPGITSFPAYAYALEFSDTALVIKPVNDGDVIVGVAQGACPTADATYNWVNLLSVASNSTTDATYGVSTSTVTGSSFDFDHTKYYINGTVFGSSSDTGFTCSSGRLTQSTDPMVIGVTPSGVFIGDNGPNDGGFVGMQAPTSNIDLNDVVLAGKEYRGVVFKDGNTGDDTQAVWARPNGSGGLTGGEWDDFEANIESTTNTTTITFGNQDSPGVVNATQTESSGGTSDMVLMVNVINSKYFIYGAYVNASDGSLANFLIVEQ